MIRVYAKARNNDPAIPYNHREKPFKSGSGFAVDIRVRDYNGSAAQRYAEGVIIGFWESFLVARKVADEVNSGTHYEPGHHFHGRAHSAIVVPAWNVSLEAGDPLPWETREGSTQMIAAYESAGEPLPLWLLQVIARLNGGGVPNSHHERTGQVAGSFERGDAPAHPAVEAENSKAGANMSNDPSGRSSLQTPSRPVEFAGKLGQLVRKSVRPGEVIMTLGTARPNRIISIGDDGVWVSTEKSERTGAGPQLVPAWMMEVAWDHLERHGQLSQKYLVDELNVKRSAFICALLSRLPNVDVEMFPIVNLVLVNPRESRGPSIAAVGPNVTADADARAIRAEHQTSASDTEIRTGDTDPTDDCTYAGRLNLLFENAHEDRGPFNCEEVAEALQADGIPLHSDSVSRLRRNIGVPPAERITFALAFFFNVDPEYLLEVVETTPDAIAEPIVTQEVSRSKSMKVDEAIRPEDEPVEVPHVRRLDGADIELSTAELLRMTAGFSQAARYRSDKFDADEALIRRMVSLLSESGPLLLQALSGNVLVPKHLLEHVLATWADSAPFESGTDSDYLWLADVLIRCMND